MCIKVTAYTSRVRTRDQPPQNHDNPNNAPPPDHKSKEEQETIDTQSNTKQVRRAVCTWLRAENNVLPTVVA